MVEYSPWRYLVDLILLLEAASVQVPCQRGARCDDGDGYCDCYGGGCAFG